MMLIRSILDIRQLVAVNYCCMIIRFPSNVWSLTFAAIVQGLVLDIIVEMNDCTFTIVQYIGATINIGQGVGTES